MDFTNLMVARRLMISSNLISFWRNGKKVEIKDARQAQQEEIAVFSSSASSSPSTEGQSPQSTQSAQPTQAVQSSQPHKIIADQALRLKDLKKKVDQLLGHNAPAAGATPQADLSGDQLRQSEITVQRQTVELALELRYTPNTPVDGLVLRNQKIAETDRYLFNFKSSDSFTIIDKWTDRSTTIWGDPHVDVSDVEGEYNGDFKDLTTSNSQTSFMLADGTRLTFTAEDSGIIEAVDIFKGSQHLTGIGGAAQGFDGAKNAFFSAPVDSDARSVSAALDLGDTVYAGGDGNDWFDAAGKLLWGKTTGTTTPTRPTGVLEMYASQTITSQIIRQQVNTIG